jgi:protein-L-isoaspartate(D-aspartate) O-methyltransferase
VRLTILILSLIMGELINQQPDRYKTARDNMVKVQIEGRGIRDEATLRSMRKVPRHLFVTKGSEEDAYGDYPLSIGYGQTISQPYIVAYMTEVVKPDKNKKALEIGTGSGYQAAVLSEIVDTVYTIEIIPELAAESSDRFIKLGYNNIIGKSGDGYNGWSDHAPFDIIIVTAAIAEVPKPLIDQLADNGRMVVPVGQSWAIQDLILFEKINGRIKKSRLTSVRFVPFKREKK